VPRVISVSDGVNLMSGTRIETRLIKVTLEEAGRIEEIRATNDGKPVEGVDAFCPDPLPPRHEVNVRVPAGKRAGDHVLEMRLGRRRFAPVPIEIAPEV